MAGWEWRPGAGKGGRVSPKSNAKPDCFISLFLILRPLISFSCIFALVITYVFASLLVVKSILPHLGRRVRNCFYSHSFVVRKLLFIPLHHEELLIF